MSEIPNDLKKRIDALAKGGFYNGGWEFVACAEGNLFKACKMDFDAAGAIKHKYGCISPNLAALVTEIEKYESGLGGHVREVKEGHAYPLLDDADEPVIICREVPA